MDAGLSVPVTLGMGSTDFGDDSCGLQRHLIEQWLDTERSVTVLALVTGIV